MGHGYEYMKNPEFARCDPRTLVPTAWEFRVHDISEPLRERWLSHYRIGSEERSGMAVLAPANRTAEGLVPEAIGQWISLPPFESNPTLTLGLGLVPQGDENEACYGDFRILAESESGAVKELFWGRLDSVLWRDFALDLTQFAGRTLRIVVENVSESILLIDYARISTPAGDTPRWTLGDLTVEVVRTDPFLIEADGILNEIGPDVSAPNRLLALEGQAWYPELRAGVPHQFGDLVETRRPRYLKSDHGMHVVTLTDQESMRRSILNRAIGNCLRIIREQSLTSLIIPPLRLGSESMEEIRLFAQDLVQGIVEWYKTHHPRQFRHIWIATLFETSEVHDLYQEVLENHFETAAATRITAASDDLIRLAGIANLVKATVTGAQLSEAAMEHLEELLDALYSATEDVRETLEGVLEEAGLSEVQMLDVVTTGYRRDGRLDDKALAAYERLHDLAPTNLENAKAMASAYRCRFRLDPEETRAVYEQIFRADASDDENNRFLAAQYLLQGNQGGGSLRQLVLEKIGLAGDSDPRSPKPGRSEPPNREMFPGEAFIHPHDRQAEGTEQSPSETDPGADEGESLTKPVEASPPEPEEAEVQQAAPSEEGDETEPTESGPTLESTDTDQLLEQLTAEVQQGRADSGS